MLADESWFAVRVSLHPTGLSQSSPATPNWENHTCKRAVRRRFAIWRIHLPQLSVLRLKLIMLS